MQTTPWVSTHYHKSNQKSTISTATWLKNRKYDSLFVVFRENKNSCQFWLFLVFINSSNNCGEVVLGGIPLSTTAFSFILRYCLFCCFWLSLLESKWSECFEPSFERCAEFLECVLLFANAHAEYSNKYAVNRFFMDLKSVQSFWESIMDRFFSNVHE